MHDVDTRYGRGRDASGGMVSATGVGDRRSRPVVGHELSQCDHEQAVVNGGCMRPIILLMLTLLIASASAAAPTKLIEFGWDEPDTAFMLAHIAEMEKTPFDGTVYHVDYTKPDKTRGRFM